MEQIGLGVVHIGDNTAQEIVGTAGPGRNGAGHSPARARFRCGYGGSPGVPESLVDAGGKLLDTVHAILSVSGIERIDHCRAV